MSVEKNNLWPETSLAIEAAKQAGQVIMEVYDKDFTTELKEDKEPVTEADIKSNEIIQKIISTSGYPILSEESIDDLNRLNHKRIWIIDPLDGTPEFIDKTGDFSIMLALVEDHLPIVGVVYQPTVDLLYISQRGKGAYQKQGGEWKKLAVSSVSDLSRLNVITSRVHLSVEEKEFLKNLNISNFIQKGSCGLKVGEICQGKAELYFTTTDKIKHWDTCAAYCLIKEAGGKMTDMLGNEILYNTEIIKHPNGILVTNGKIHNQIVENYKIFLRY